MDAELLRKLQEFDTSIVAPLIDSDGVKFDPFVPEPDDPFEFNPATYTGDEYEYDETRVEVTRFVAHHVTQASAPRGEHKVTFTVSADQKYQAVAATDWPGVRVEVIVTRPQLPSELRTGERRVSTGQLLQAVRGIFEQADA